MLNLDDVRNHTEVGTGYKKDAMLNLCADEITTLRKRVGELEKWQEMAFLAHPNIDIDIEHHQRNNHDRQNNHKQERD